MKWKYKYEAGMDTNDADYVYQSGELGVFDDEVREAFIEKCKSYGLEEADYKNFYVDGYDYRPRDPNDDSCAHDLGFSFSRLPVDVIEQNVDEYCLRQYYNVSKENIND